MIGFDMLLECEWNVDFFSVSLVCYDCDYNYCGYSESNIGLLLLLLLVVVVFLVDPGCENVENSPNELTSYSGIG